MKGVSAGDPLNNLQKIVIYPIISYNTAMTPEFPSSSLIKGAGEIVLSYDTASPDATIVGRNLTVHHSARVDVRDSIRHSDSMLPNSIAVTESFDDDGNLYNWQVEVGPKLNPDTLNNITHAGAPDCLNAKMLDLVAGYLPKVDVERGGRIVVQYQEDSSVTIGEEGILYSDRDGQFEVLREGVNTPTYASSHERIELSMSVDDFLAPHVKDMEGLSINAYIVIRNTSITDINNAIGRVLADKTLNPEEREIRLRSLVNVVFELRKADNK